jgi:hypothetical protein
MKAILVLSVDIFAPTSLSLSLSCGHSHADLIDVHNGYGQWPMVKGLIIDKRT